jgi:hypothetical protein
VNGIREKVSSRLVNKERFQKECPLYFVGSSVEIACLETLVKEPVCERNVMLTSSSFIMLES